MHNPHACPICKQLLEDDHAEALTIQAAMLRLNDSDFVVVDEPTEFGLMLIEADK